MLRSVVLDGAYPVIGESPWYPENADVVKTGFNAACARNAYCSTLPGTSLSRLRMLVRQVRGRPLHGKAPDGEGVMRDVVVDPGMIGLMLFGGSGPLIYRDLDAAARALAERNDGVPLLRLAAEVIADEDPVAPRDFSYGLFAAVSCMDYQQIYDMRSPIAARRGQRRQAITAQKASHPDSFDPLTIREFLDVPLDTSVLDLCLRWPVHNPPYTPGQPIPAGMPFTSAPTLVINGELDTLTAPEGGAIVAAQFANAQHIVVANSFHVDAIYDTDDCASKIVRRFIATLDAGDVSCAANVKPVRLVPFFPRRARDAIPAKPGSGNTATARDLALASAAVQTAGDVIARWYINFTTQGRGLHGGTWSYTGYGLVPHFTLHNVRWVRDLKVSGNAVWNGRNGRVRGTLTWQNQAGENAQIDVRWNDRDHNGLARLSGSVGGRTIHATMPAP